jgi:hypothetical protein
MVLAKINVSIHNSDIVLDLKVHIVVFVAARIKSLIGFFSPPKQVFGSGPVAERIVVSLEIRERLCPTATTCSPYKHGDNRST